jgi:hypothetical protein
LPSSLEPPFEKETYRIVKNLIERNNEITSSISKASIECLNNIVIKAFPYDYLENEDSNYIADLLINLAKNFYDEEYDLELIAEKYNKPLQDVNDLFIEFDSIVKD